MSDCIGKRAFPSGAMARKALAGIRANGTRLPDGKKPCRAYACGRCRKFHLTSMWDKTEDEA